MSRIEPVPTGSGGPLVRFSFAKARRMAGEVPEPFAVMAHHRTVMLTYGALESGVARQRKVDKRLKELAWMKAAMSAGCAWCVDYGEMTLLAQGVTEEQLRALPDHRASALFTDREKLVLDLAAGMTATPVDVSDELFAALRVHFDDEQLVELAFAIGVENLRARFNWALGIESQGFSNGTCALPAPAAPA